MNKENPFNKEEDEIAGLLAQVHNKYVNMKNNENENEGHPMEIQEWVSAIHQLQSILEHRAFRRIYSEYFR